jgi:hypothetical protein
VKTRADYEKRSPIWSMGDRLEHVDPFDYINSLDDKGLREFVAEILLLMGETTGVVMAELEVVKEKIEQIGGSK